MSITDTENFEGGSINTSKSILEYVASVSSSPDVPITFMHPSRNEQEKDKGYHSDRELIMNLEDWTNLGCPNEITITIEAGDKLNTDEVGDELNAEQD